MSRSSSFSPTAHIMLSEVIPVLCCCLRYFLEKACQNIQVNILRVIAHGDVTFHLSQPSKARAQWNNEWFRGNSTLTNNPPRNLFKHAAVPAACCWPDSCAVWAAGRDYSTVPASSLYKPLTWRKCWRKLPDKQCVLKITWSKQDIT